MNILPKKRWHVRTKDNIARVRKDEAEAAEQAKKTKEQIGRAEQEARINYLRRKCNSIDPIKSDKKDNLTPFEIFKADDGNPIRNKEYEKEKKKDDEKYDKQTGYLTYLGQFKDEDPHLKRWYELPRTEYSHKKSNFNEEKDIEKKIYYDPIKKYKKKKEKLEDHSLKQSKNIKKSKDLTIQEMRKKRLIREAAEKIRQDKLLNK